MTASDQGFPRPMAGLTGGPTTLAGTGLSAGDPDHGVVGSEPAYAGRSRLWPAFIAMVALASFFAVAFYAYSWGTGETAPGDLPLVRADAEPEKVRPEDPGGMEVPHQDTLVLNRAAAETRSPTIERLLPPPETPKPPKPTVTVQPVLPAPEEAAPATQATSVETALRAPSVPSIAALVEETPAPGTPAPETPAPETAALETAAGPGESSAGQTADAPALPSAQAAEPAEAGSSVQDSAPPTPVKKPKPAAGPQLAAITGGQPYALQLVSVRSAESAKKEGQRLQRVFPNLLGNLKLEVQKATVSGKGTVYRLRFGPFPNRATARDLCAQLKAKKQDCFVVRR